MPALSRALLPALGIVLAVLVSPEVGSAQARKAPAKKAAVVKAATPPPPRKPPPPREITCGPPLPEAMPVKPEKKKGLLGKIGSIGKKEVKLPEACVLARFKDPAFPITDPNALGGSAVGLFGGEGPVQAEWLISMAELQEVADAIADLGPRPTVRATVLMSNLTMAEAHAVYLKPGGKDGVIILTTQLIQSLRNLSLKMAGHDADAKVAPGAAPVVETEEQRIQANKLTQQYLAFIIAHEYAHLVLNHPQKQTKAARDYQELGQAIAMAGLAYAVINQMKIDSKASYSEKEREGRKSAGVFLAASFAGDIAATEGTRFIFPIFNRGVERDADMLAVDILRRSKVDPGVGVRGLNIFLKENKENVRKSGQMSDEAKQTAAEAALLMAAVAPDLINGDKEEFEKKLKTAALLFAASFALRKLEEHRMMVEAHLHDSPGEREHLVTEYQKAFYGLASVMRDAPAPMSKFAEVAEAEAAKGAKPPVVAPPPKDDKVAIPEVDFKKIGAEVDGYVATEAAKTALARGDLVEARRQVDVALKSPIKATIDVQLVAGGLAQAEGDQDAAIRHFRAVLAHGFRSPSVYRNIVDSQRLKKDDAGALKTIAEGVSATGQLSEFILERMDIHRFLKNDKALAEDLEACIALKDLKLEAACRRAAQPDPLEEPAPAASMATAKPAAAAPAQKAATSKATTPPPAKKK